MSEPTKRRAMIRVPIDASPEFVRMYHTLKELASSGCERLVPPNTCRRDPGGYPRNQWCWGCIAADGLDLPADWFQLR